MATIPVKSAMIVCNDVGASRGKFDHRIKELRVVDVAEGRAYSRFENSSGACDADWLKGHWRWTPMGLFLELMTCDGFESREALIKALQEFHQIEGEKWPADLLHELGQKVDEEDN
jgi:hypothetical protein